MQVTSVKLHIGDYDILPIPTGIFGLDGGAMFGTVPRTLWEKTNPPDSKNRIPMEARALLLKGTKRKILIDAGNGGDFIEKYGEKLGSKFSEIYALGKWDAPGSLNYPKDLLNPHPHESATLESSLQRVGVNCDEITDVILTHLHFDHCGGGVKAEKGRLVPRFKNATYYIQAENLETARFPNVREKASYFASNFQPLIDHNCLRVLNGPEQLLEGVKVFTCQGHTRGQQLVKVEDSKHCLVYCGDLIPTSSHVRLPFVMGYDLDPLQVIKEKGSLLNESLSDHRKNILFFEHDPYCDGASIEASGADFKVKEYFSFVAK